MVLVRLIIVMMIYHSKKETMETSHVVYISVFCRELKRFIWLPDSFYPEKPDTFDRIDKLIKEGFTVKVTEVAHLKGTVPKV